jgi:cysteinyl-tRNA synthetase
MPIKIYNTLTRTKEDFIPIEPGKVKMYVCGPTVYNHIHIGNARPVIFFDAVRRYFQYQGYEVNFIQNFTDVDDRIIQAGIDMGKTAQEVSDMFIHSYHENTEKLGVQKADMHPRVTETMDDIIVFIEQLIGKGLAYESAGDVYYRTRKFKGYGKLSHQKVDELIEGVRIEVGEKKESALDFALWKTSKENEVSWDSPWGRGRPGWHIECSAMIKKYMGDTIDIHGGGLDLSFPHHENEIAQTEGLTNKPLANYWMHNAMLNINNQKMSKSVGNFVRLNDVVEKHNPQIIRFYMLSGQYRSVLNYSDELIEQAKNGYERLVTTVANLEHRTVNSVVGTRTTEITESCEAWKVRFIEAMDDDFNTADAISVLFELAREINSYLRNEEVIKGNIKSYMDTMIELGNILGLNFITKEELLDNEVEQLIEERIEARKNKDFSRADEIRNLLTQQGILLEDTPQGLRWRRK